MGQPALNYCYFCHKSFKTLGNHYKGCPERNGADCEHLLSHRTLENKSRGKAKKLTCPKCGKRLTRLETHLRRNASCKNVTFNAEQSTTPPTSLPIPQATTFLSRTEPSRPSSSPHPPTPLPQPKFPTNPEQWAEMDTFVQANIVPAVLCLGDVNMMHHVITEGLYTYLVSRFGAMPDNHHCQYL